MAKESLSLLEQAIGYCFSDADLLRQATTHKSFSNECSGVPAPHNERLEFLGDAVLDLVVSQELFRCFPQLPEGELTRARAEVVSEASLAAQGRKLRIGALLRLGRGESRSGGADKDSLLADAFEAILGAVFCDGDFVAARAVIIPLLGEAIEQGAASGAGSDYKTRLQELFQARYGHPPKYLLVQVEGPDHQRLYSVEVLMEDRVLGRGRARTKKGAQQEAARQALDRLEGPHG